MLLPAGRITASAMLPVPAAILPVAPPVADEVNAAPKMVAAKESATTAVAASGPVLLTTMVYVTFEPAATEAGANLLIDKSDASRRRSSKVSTNSRPWNRDREWPIEWALLRREESTFVRLRTIRLKDILMR